MDDDIDAPFKRAVEHRRQAGVVDDDRHADLAGDRGDLFEREDVQRRIAEALAIERLGVRTDGPAERVGILGVDERHLDADPGQRVVEEIVGAAVKLRDGHDVVAGAGEIENGIRDRRLAGRVGERAGAALERRHPLLEDVGRWIHDPRVDVPEFLQRKQVCGVLGVAEYVAGRLVDRDGARARRGIRRLAGVKSPCSKSFEVHGRIHGLGRPAAKASRQRQPAAEIRVIRKGRQPDAAGRRQRTSNEPGVSGKTGLPNRCELMRSTSRPTS